MSVAAVIDKRRLQRRLDPRYLCQIDIAFYLLLGRRLEIEFFETSAAGYHHPRFFGMGGIDEHALCHSGGTPRRAAAAASEAAGGAAMWVEKPVASDVMASRDWVIGVASVITPGFGSLRSVSPDAAARRGGKKRARAAGQYRNAAGRDAR